MTTSLDDLRRRAARSAALLLLLLATACGSGQGATAPRATPVIDLGLLSSTEPSRVLQTFANPLAVPATVTAGAASGPFALDPADLPATVLPGGTVDLGVIFDPAGPGPASGALVVRFDGSAGALPATYEVHARAELVRWTLLTPPLAFGEVAVGDWAEATAAFRNDSLVSTVSLTTALLPSGDFSLVESPLPLVLSPGASAAVVVRFAPSAPGTWNGLLRLGPGDAGGPVDVPITASAPEPPAFGETIVEFGTVPLDANGRTPVLAVNVPADAVSVTVEGRMGPTNVVGLGTLTGPDGHVYENASYTGPFFWTSWTEAFSAQIPNSDQAAVQLRGAGTYTFSLRRLGGLGSTMEVRAIIETRPGGDATAPVLLDLNVWLAPALAPSAATAASDPFLQAVLGAVDTILAQQGMGLGEVAYHDIASAAFDDIETQAEFEQLLASSGAASSPRMNVFLVRTAFGGNVLGVAGAIPGTKRNGTVQSGVMVDYDFFGTNPANASSVAGVAETVAHEIGHYLGLYHTVEQYGGHDYVDDTPNCPANGTNATCPTPGAGLLMHWQAVGGAWITDGQGLVIRGHPHARPTASSTARRAARGGPDLIVLSLASPPRPEGWCGTCEGRRPP